MDTNSLIIVCILVILAVVSLVLGIFSFVKYSKTGKKYHLILGIVFTFIVPGILLYFAFRFYISSTLVVYMPSPGPESGMVYMPGPV